MQHHPLFFRAAGITIQLHPENTFSKNTLDPRFNFFKIDGLGQDNVVIQHYLSDIPKDDIQSETDLKTVFNDGTWKLSVSKSTCIYHYHSEEWFPTPYSVTTIFNGDHSTCRAYFSGIDINQYQNLSLMALTGLGTDQILMSNLLADRDGFLFHSNGVALLDKTILFTGISGAGKSTISSMMEKAGGQIFCDDRTIIRKHGSEYSATGSWIHPGVSSVSRHTGKIDAVFFLEQSKKNEIIPITHQITKYEKALKALVKNFFMIDKWEQTLNLLDIFVKTTPFFTIKFDLTGDICHLVAHELEKL